MVHAWTHANWFGRAKRRNQSGKDGLHEDEDASGTVSCHRHGELNQSVRIDEIPERLLDTAVPV